ncbi:Uncharacterised protein [Salmonella enterica subsp. enterica serovar Bovismorbificans]|nr:Uncharacterised protein [Salmonella enterica subsp. enterica serovar Bovismorbificans]
MAGESQLPPFLRPAFAITKRNVFQRIVAPGLKVADGENVCQLA